MALRIKSTKNVHLALPLVGALAVFVFALFVMGSMPRTARADKNRDAQRAPSVVFTNPAPISIPSSGAATPYPSAIVASGLPASLPAAPDAVNVTINSYSHTFPDDVGFVLVGPTGAALNISDGAGDGTDMVNVTYTISDTGATQLPTAGAWGPGTYRPANYYSDVFPAPGPASYQNPGPLGGGTATFSSTFGGTNPNGTWNLYVVDFVGGDTGNIAGGWSLEIIAGAPLPQTEQIFNSSLSTTQEVPTPTPFGSLTGSGIGQAKLNAAQDQLTVALSYTGLGSNAIAAHIHGNALSVPGQTGPVIFDLMPSGGTSGTNTATTFGVTAAQVTLLRSKLMYFNVHTTNNPSGEIRGQIHLNEMSTNFDADGITDFAIFRPSSGLWAVVNSSNNAQTLQTFGLNTDSLVPGDYDGDGKTDLAIERTGDWHILRSSDSTLFSQTFGTGSDVRAPADYDKDGRTDLAFFRPANGDWSVLLSSGGTHSAHWGQSGDTPVPADYDRDGKADLAVVRPNDPNPGVRRWYIFRSSDGVLIDQVFGNTSDIAVPGDFNGDGLADIAVYRPSEGAWYVSRGSAQVFDSFFWGTANDLPAPGDYDSDGKTDYAVYNQLEGAWYVRQSLTGTLKAFVWGLNGDTPVPSIYNR